MPSLALFPSFPPFPQLSLSSSDTRIHATDGLAYLTKFIENYFIPF